MSNHCKTCEKTPANTANGNPHSGHRAELKSLKFSVQILLPTDDAFKIVPRVLAEVLSGFVRGVLRNLNALEGADIIVQIEEQPQTPVTQHMGGFKVPCDWCNGTGKYGAMGNCPECGGQG